MEQELVEKISNSGIKKSKIEKDLDMPENSLSGMVNGKRDTPPKWAKAISEYLDKNKIQFGGLTMAPGSTAVILDETPDAFKIKDIEMDTLEQYAWELIKEYCKEKKTTVAEIINIHAMTMAIKDIEKEVIPENRNTPMGKITWEADKKKRIEHIKKQIQND